MTWCSTCRREVERGHVTVIGGSERGSGAPTVRYGCAPAPVTSPQRAFIGHRHTPPEAPRRPA